MKKYFIKFFKIFISIICFLIVFMSFIISIKIISETISPLYIMISLITFCGLIFSILLIYIIDKL
jgi:hypothetical protein